jgi:hypothetical protein
MTTTEHTGYHVRTENGIPALLPSKEALAEADHVMTDKAAKRTTREMCWAGSSGHIVYRDGRKVSIRPATAEDIAALTPAEQPERIPFAPEGARIVEAKGKQYVVTRIRPGQSANNQWGRPIGSVDYWTFKNGKAFGPTMTAMETARPNTVGAAIWAQVTA